MSRAKALVGVGYEAALGVGGCVKAAHYSQSRLFRACHFRENPWNQRAKWGAAGALMALACRQMAAAAATLSDSSPPG